MTGSSRSFSTTDAASRGCVCADQTGSSVEKSNAFRSGLRNRPATLTIASPAPIVCTVPAGMKYVSPGATSIQRSSRSISPLTAASRIASAETGCVNPSAIRAPVRGRGAFAVLGD